MGPKTDGSKKSLKKKAQKHFGSRKILGQKNWILKKFWIKKEFGQNVKKFGSKNFGSKTFLGQRKLGGVRSKLRALVPWPPTMLGYSLKAWGGGWWVVVLSPNLVFPLEQKERRKCSNNPCVIEHI